ncbi:Secreted protein OS=Streptomyces glaucescens OX=1907 GN=SGLAU_22270 PE=4 SV=1 [Streptomyces glaucescens]
MISINTSSISTVKMTDRSVVASLCMLGFSDQGTGLSGIRAVHPGVLPAVAGLPVREGNERPTKALEAAVEAKAQAYAFTATGAGFRTQTTQHHRMWAFRGPEPWSDPA